MIRCLLLCFALSMPAVAGVDAERELLARLEHEIELLTALIDQAESQAEPGQRVHFDYPALRLDLDRVRLGIREYRVGGRFEPRPVPPLAGDYQQ